MAIFKSFLHSAPDRSATFLTVLAGRTVKKLPSPIGPGFESQLRQQKGHRSIGTTLGVDITAEHNFLPNQQQIENQNLFWPTIFITDCNPTIIEYVQYRTHFCVEPGQISFIYNMMDVGYATQRINLNFCANWLNCGEIWAIARIEVNPFGY